jgi:hypothetical protein
MGVSESDFQFFSLSNSILIFEIYEISDHIYSYQQRKDIRSKYVKLISTTN